VTAVLENFAQVPFRKQHKLYVSPVPYEISLSGGESIHTDQQRTQSQLEAVEKNLKQMKTMRAAKVSCLGSSERTQPRNAVLVMVSEVGNRPYTHTLRLFSKTIGIAVFVAGTCFFASATLISISMSTFALAFVIGAGIFSRAIVGWIVRRVAETEPMIHFIAHSQEEANHAILRLLKLELSDKADVQVEIGGHIFVNGRRVARRSRLHVGFLGVLASPYDLIRAKGSSKADHEARPTPIDNSHVLPK